jgi:tetratricopeptide (TPR) repeat protein
MEDLQREGILRKKHDVHNTKKRRQTTPPLLPFGGGEPVCLSPATSSTLSSHISRRRMSLDSGCSWDSDDIVQFVEQSKSRTVVDAVADKINHLPDPQIKHALILASYLGSQFDLTTLHNLFLQEAAWPHRRSASAINKDGDNDDGDKSADDCLCLSQDNLARILDVAVLEGLLINVVGSTQYQFTHDDVQEASYNMIPAGPDRDQLLFRIGYFLQESHAQDGHKNNNVWMLFAAARHWSKISNSQRTNYVDPVDLAALYLKCGVKARAMSAFEEAARCFRNGIDSLLSLNVDLWKEGHYDLALEFYQSSAELELLLGNYDYGFEVSNVVLQNAKTLLEKMPTYYAMDDALGIQERHDEALALNMEVLKELDEVPSVWSGVRDFFHVKRLINNTSDEEILNLSEITDPTKLAVMRCLANVSFRSFCCGNFLLMIAITLKLVKKMLEEGGGLCGLTPPILAAYGIALLSGMGHPSTGKRMGHLAREVIHRRNFDEEECKTLFLVGTFVDIWTVAYSDIITTYERGHDIGLMTGNLDYAYACELEVVKASFVAGTSLETVVDRQKSLMSQVLYYKKEAIARTIYPFDTLLFHLTHNQPTDDSSGEPICINWEDFCLGEETRKESANHHTLTWASLYGVILSFLMDQPVMAEITDKFHNLKPAQSYYVCSLGSFFSALVYARMAHTSKRSQHKNLARKHAKEMNKLVEKGCTKNRHRNTLLRAELLSIDKPQKQSLIQELYNEAIALAGECDCYPDQALANELAGEYFLRQKRSYTAKDYLVKACTFYMKW